MICSHSYSPAGDFDVWPGHTGNWGRWPNDRGALNLLTPDAVMRGVGSARLGEVYPLSRPIRHAESMSALDLYEQEMTHVRDVPDACETKTQSAADKLTFRVHNLENTHIDALSHIGYGGRNFNGYANADVVSMTEGAKLLDITSALGIVTRGMFIDVARKRGLDYLEPGDVVTPNDLAGWVERVEPGDIAIIRCGATLSGGRPSETDERGLWSGIHPECVDLLAQRGISLIGGDATEPGPSPVAEHCSRPFHVICLTVYGIHIIHGLDLEQLATRCAELGRDEFLFMASALNLPGATGSPITPLAVL